MTRWTIVSMARGGEDAAARLALEELCKAYWYPLYGFARRKGLSPMDAEDAVQAFFLKLLEQDSFDRADREKGRLRSFLLGALSNFLAQRWRNENAAKRGGGMKHLRIDQAWAEERLVEDSSEGDGLEEFDREWAYALIERVFERMRSFHASRGREAVFEKLKGCLMGDGAYGDEADLAVEMGLSGAGVRSAVFQMRQRFRRYVEEEIRDTVGSEADLRDELAHLCRVLADHRG
ncbi:RNA polymerase sigma factor [Haloferula rosea]|uniref:Sigma-70 family RNA polymerase sigma factor n=1 Tax=Haloferula rosea TaxID=490093 RepID=A0A934RAY4_9BACT|nr:sigma factor [Haloferula rosea]MBK1827288.1 sigma-70 family RNA polymerase sigma factor [Haloferula rosea]